MVYNININGTDRPMTTEETAAYEQTAKEMLADTKKMQDVETAKAVAREALLTRLGITADEAQLLLGS